MSSTRNNSTYPSANLELLRCNLNEISNALNDIYTDQGIKDGITALHKRAIEVSHTVAQPVARAKGYTGQIQDLPIRKHSTKVTKPRSGKRKRPLPRPLIDPNLQRWPRVRAATEEAKRNHFIKVAEIEVRSMEDNEGKKRKFLKGLLDSIPKLFKRTTTTTEALMRIIHIRNQDFSKYGYRETYWQWLIWCQDHKHIKTHFYKRFEKDYSMSVQNALRCGEVFDYYETHHPGLGVIVKNWLLDCEGGFAVEFLKIAERSDTVMKLANLVADGWPLFRTLLYASSQQTSIMKVPRLCATLEKYQITLNQTSPATEGAVDTPTDHTNDAQASRNDLNLNGSPTTTQSTSSSFPEDIDPHLSVMESRLSFPEDIDPHLSAMESRFSFPEDIDPHLSAMESRFSFPENIDPYLSAMESRFSFPEDIDPYLSVMESRFNFHELPMIDQQVSDKGTQASPDDNGFLMSFINERNSTADVGRPTIETNTQPLLQFINEIPVNLGQVGYGQAIHG